MTDSVLKEALINPDFGIQLLTELKHERDIRMKSQVKNAQQQVLISEKEEQNSKQI